MFNLNFVWKMSLELQ